MVTGGRPPGVVYVVIEVAVVVAGVVVVTVIENSTILSRPCNLLSGTFSRNILWVKERTKV